MNEKEKPEPLIDVVKVDFDEVRVEFVDMRAPEDSQTVNLHPAFVPPGLQVGDALVLVRRATNVKQFTDAAIVLFASWLNIEVAEARQIFDTDPQARPAAVPAHLTQSKVVDVANLLDQYTRQLPSVLFHAVGMFAQVAGEAFVEEVTEQGTRPTTVADLCERMKMHTDFAKQNEHVPSVAQAQLLRVIAIALDAYLRHDAAAGQLSYSRTKGEDDRA